MTTESLGISPGDTLRIERRYIVDGQLTCVTDQGRFMGLERVGSSEHIVIRDSKKKELRMFPLHAIAEITLVRAVKRGKKGASDEPQAQGQEQAWDPSFG
ncbi:MAG: hypothetical protein WDA16_03465 [Candidatus Thermoplasmatota archaeon]|jgi:hypothetical protein